MGLFSNLFKRSPPVLYNPSEGLPQIADAVAALQAHDLNRVTDMMVRMELDARLHWSIVLLNSFPQDRDLPLDVPDLAGARAAGTLGTILSIWLLWAVQHDPSPERREALKPLFEATEDMLARGAEATPEDPALTLWQLACRTLMDRQDPLIDTLSDRLDDLDEPSLMIAHLRMTLMTRRLGGTRAGMWRFVERQTSQPPSAGWLGLIARAQGEDLHWAQCLEPDKAVRKRALAAFRTPQYRAEMADLTTRFLTRIRAEGMRHATARRYGFNAFGHLMVQLDEGGHAAPLLAEIGDVPMHLHWPGPLRLKDWNRARAVAMMPPLRG